MSPPIEFVELPKRPWYRCPAKDTDGHRCTFRPPHEGPHRAFGKEWEK